MRLDGTHGQLLDQASPLLILKFLICLTLQIMGLVVTILVAYQLSIAVWHEYNTVALRRLIILQQLVVVSFY